MPKTGFEILNHRHKMLSATLIKFFKSQLGIYFDLLDNAHDRAFVEADDGADLVTTVQRSIIDAMQRQGL